MFAKILVACSAEALIFTNTPVLLATFSISDSAGDYSCLLRTNSFDSTQNVYFQPCHLTLDANNDPLPNAIWMVTSTGKIIAKNGYCLTVPDDEINLLASSGQCETSWDITGDTLNFGNRTATLKNDGTLALIPSRQASNLLWITFKATKEGILPLIPPQILHSSPNFREENGFLRTSSKRTLAELNIRGEHLRGNMKHQIDQLSEINTTLNLLASWLDIERPLTGTGVLVEFFHSGDRMPISQTVYPELAVTRPLLHRMGLSVQAPLAFKVSGQLVPPIYGQNLAFNIYGLTGDLQVYVSGKLILEQWGPPIEGKQLTTTSFSHHDPNQKIDFSFISQGVSLTTSTFSAALIDIDTTKETPIYTDHLYPNLFGAPVCAPNGGDLFPVDCHLTFSSVSFVLLTHISCSDIHHVEPALDFQMSRRAL